MSLMIPVFCPCCGEKVDARLVLNQIDVYSYTTLKVTFKETNIAHTCKEKPDTDGLNPIDRFVQHGALDDLGSELSHNRYSKLSNKGN